MNRIDRLQAILTTLQSKRVVKAEDLATRFDVSVRTIYRDIRSLEAGGIPIGAEAGIGYFLTEGYHIPPVMFTHEEARALLLAGKIVEKTTDKQVTANFDAALTKVRAVLDMEKKEELEGLEKDIIINPFPNEQQPHGPEELQIDKIKEALSTSRVINFDYHSAGKGEFTNRNVEPIGLCYYYNKWHLIAYCQMREAYRDFRLDRVSKLLLTHHGYARFRRMSLQEYLDKLVHDTELELCVISVSKSIHRFLESYKYSMGLVKEEEKEDRVEMHFATYSLSFFARSLLTLGTQVELIAPQALKEEVQKAVEEISRKYLSAQQQMEQVFPFLGATLEGLKKQEK